MLTCAPYRCVPTSRGHMRMGRRKSGDPLDPKPQLRIRKIKPCLFQRLRLRHQEYEYLKAEFEEMFQEQILK